MKALRVFYKKSDSKIVWNSSLEGTGVFPYSIEEELKNLPNTKIAVTLTSEGTPLGGEPDDYACIEISDEAIMASFMASDTNTVENGKLVTGTARPTPEPTPLRDLAKEIDELDARISNIEATKAS